jgi:hypothetical protein
MIRKDITLDADRPHYYSQFWIDVAMGKREVGGAQTATAEPDNEPVDDEQPEPIFADRMVDIEPEIELEPPIVRTPPAPKKPEPKKPEPARPSLSSLADLAKIEALMRDSAQMDDDTVPDIENAASSPIEEEEPVATNFDVGAADLEAAEEPVSLDEQLADEEFDEDFDEEEDDEWGSGGPRRGSKPNKRRREPRRDF